MKNNNFILNLAEKIQQPFLHNKSYLNYQAKIAIALQPYDIKAFSGNGIYLETNKGTLMDFCSMTMNNILGQNDFWVKANLIKFLASDYPSYLTSRFEHSLNAEAILSISKIGNFDQPIVNHKQCNGSDVTELAIKSGYNNREEHQTKLLSFKGSFHGQNLTNFLSSDMKRKHLFFFENTSMVEFLPLPPNCENLDTHTSITKEESVILKIIEKKHIKNAFSLIIEPIQVNNEIYMFSIPFVKELKKICLAHNVSFIFDEIQTACGWLGEESAAERYQVVPDIIAVSKGLTGGNGPLAAIISNKKHNNLELGSAEKTNGADLRSLITCIAVLERLRGVP